MEGTEEKLVEALSMSQFCEFPVLQHKRTVYVPLLGNDELETDHESL
jgi:hypothetical protein